MNISKFKSMSVKERIKSICKELGISVSSFEKSIGVANGYVNSISKNIGVDKIKIILEKYPNINIEWIQTGTGEMFHSDNNGEICKVPTGGIPLIPINAMAGIAKGENTILEYECERYVVPIFREAEFLIPVKGSSMLPKYNSGDIVACKWVPLTDIFFQWNKVYVLDTNQGALIKRVHKGSDDQHITLVSDNKNYEPFEVALSAINAIAIVIGVIRLE